MQKGLFCTREAAAGLRRGHDGLFYTREAPNRPVSGAVRAVLHTGGAGAGGMRRRAGVSTPGHGQGEGPDGYKFPHSGDAVDVGRGRSERSERSPARCWQTADKTSVIRSRGQEKPFCTREAAASRSRGQEGLFCSREGGEPAGCGGGRETAAGRTGISEKKSKVFGNINFCHTFAVY